eukprot:gene6057-10058_t
MFPCWHNKPIFQISFIIGIAFLYLFGGTIVFHFLENVSYLDSFYWCLTLNWQTGVLYYIYPNNSFIPSNNISKYFSMLYITLGYPMIGFAFYDISELILNKQDEFLKSKFSFLSKSSKSKLKSLKIFILIFIHFNLSFIQFITYLIGEQKWSFTDCLYFTFITGAFLGETNIYPTNMITKIISTIICLCTTSIFYLLLGEISSWIFYHHQDILTKKYLNEQLSKVVLKRMDKNKDGHVSYQEYLEYILLKCELIDQIDLNKIENRFKQLDIDNNNQLDENDLLIKI